MRLTTLEKGGKGESSEVEGPAKVVNPTRSKQRVRLLAR